MIDNNTIHSPPTSSLIINTTSHYNTQDKDIQRDNSFLHETIEIDKNLSKSFYTIDQNETICELKEMTSRIIKNGCGSSKGSENLNILKDVLKSYIEYEKRNLNVKKKNKWIRYGIGMVVGVGVGIYLWSWNEKPF